MKSSIKELKDCKMLLDIEVSKETVQEKFDEVYDEISKRASVPGFRTGRVPRDLLEQRFGKLAKEEVLKKIVPDSYKEALIQYKLKPISLPEISNVRLEKESLLYFRAELEIRPEFDIKNYKGLRLKRKDLQLKEEDVARALEALREANAQFVPSGDSKDKQKILPELDDEFAKDLGFGTLNELKGSIRSSLEQKKKMEIETDLELQVIDQLVKMHSFEVPESLVREQKQRLLKDAKERIKYLESLQKNQGPKEGLKFSQKDLEELEERAGQQALKQVRAFFIIDKITEKEKIYITQEELDKRIEEIAKAHGKGVQEIRSYLEKHNILEEMVLNMRNAKVMDFLLKEADITD